MPSLQFTPGELEQIDHGRFYHPCPQIQKRMEVLRPAAHGLPQAEIAQLTGLSKATIQRRLADFRRGRLGAVEAWNYRGRPSILHQHAATLEEHFRTHPPATVADARAVIEEKTGVRRGLTQVRLFLKKLRPRLSQGPRRPGEGRCRRPEAVPRRRPATLVEKSRLA